MLKKIRGYEQQDMKAGREIHSENYIDKEWLMSTIGMPCKSCGCNLYCEVVDGCIDSNITADRTMNSMDHNLDNITAMCGYCNSSFSNRSK